MTENGLVYSSWLNGDNIHGLLRMRLHSYFCSHLFYIEYLKRLALLNDIILASALLSQSRVDYSFFNVGFSMLLCLQLCGCFISMGAPSGRNS